MNKIPNKYISVIHYSLDIITNMSKEINGWIRLESGKGKKRDRDRETEGERERERKIPE